LGYANLGYSSYCSYLGKELPWIKNSQTEFFNIFEMPFVVGDNSITLPCYRNFKNKVIGWIRQERAPEEEDVLLISYMTQKVDKIADIFFSYGAGKLTAP